MTLSCSPSPKSKIYFHVVLILVFYFRMSRIRENGAYFFYKEVFLSLLPKILKKEIGWKIQYEYAVSTFYQLPEEIRRVFEELKSKEKQKMADFGKRLNFEEKMVPGEILVHIEGVIEKGY